MLSAKQELLLIEYQDGAMSARRRAEAETLLKSSSEARQMLRKHQRLDRLLQQTAAPLDLNWDAVMEGISASLVLHADTHGGVVLHAGTHGGLGEDQKKFRLRR